MAQLLIAVLDVERLLAHSASHLQLAQSSRIGDPCRRFGAIEAVRGFEIEEACTDAFSETGLKRFSNASFDAPTSDAIRRPHRAAEGWPIQRIC
jgi:hypothetical protein